MVINSYFCRRMKLQQKIAMGLCAFYLITVIGIAVNMHFCGGKLSSVKLVEQARCVACKDGNKMKKAHDCCEDKSVDVKVKDSHEAAFKVKLPQDYSLQLFFGPIVSKSISIAFQRIFSRIDNKAPPRSAVIALHLYHCVFRN